MDWARKQAGWYEAEANDGTRWRVVQANSNRWEVFRDLVLVASWPMTLSEAKWLAEREQKQGSKPNDR